MEEKQLQVVWGTSYSEKAASMNIEGTDPTFTGLKLAEICSWQLLREYLNNNK